MTHSTAIRKQVLNWLKKQGIKAIAILKITGRCAVYQLSGSYKKGCSFVPKNMLVESGKDQDGNEYEVFQHSARIWFMVKHLKRPGKGGRLSKINNIYVGTHCRLDGFDLAQEMGRNSFNSKVRDPQRVTGYNVEVVLRGDWTMEILPRVEAAITKLEKRPIRDFSQIDW